MRLKPYLQGDVDGLCGLYSAVNALRLIEKKLTLDECYEEVHIWLTALEKRRGEIAKVIINGLYLYDLNFVLNLMAEKFDVTKFRPFYKQANIPFNVYWDTLKSFFEEGDQRAVIAGYENRRLDDSHWSVIKKVTDKSIHLFDSCGRRYILKSKCMTQKMNGNQTIVLYPAQTFFLIKHDNGNNNGNGKQKNNS